MLGEAGHRWRLRWLCTLLAANLWQDNHTVPSPRSAHLELLPAVQLQKTLTQLQMTKCLGKQLLTELLL